MDDIPLPPPAKTSEDYSPSQVTSDLSGDEEDSIPPIPLPPTDDDADISDLPSPPKVHIPRSVLGKDNAKKRFQSFKAAKSGISFKPLKVKKTVLPLFKDDDDDSSFRSKRHNESTAPSAGGSTGKMNIDSIMEEERTEKEKQREAEKEFRRLEEEKARLKRERKGGSSSSSSRSGRENLSSSSAFSTASVPPPKLLSDLPPLFSQTSPEKSKSAGAGNDKPTEPSKAATGE